MNQRHAGVDMVTEKFDQMPQAHMEAIVAGVRLVTKIVVGGEVDDRQKAVELAGDGVKKLVDLGRVAEVEAKQALFAKIVVANSGADGRKRSHIDAE